MKINSVEVGEEYEIDGQDSITKEPLTIRFRVLEIGSYPSKTKPGAFYRGAKVLMLDTKEGDIEHVFDFLLIEMSRKVES